MEGLSAGHELPFAVSFSGHSGHLRLQPLHPSERHNAVSNLPDLILPPAYEPETPETIIKKLEDEYLTPALDNKEFDPDVCGKQWEFDWFNKAVLHLQPSQPRLSVVPVWEAPYKRKSKQTSTDTKETSSLWIPESLEIALIDTEENAKDSSSLLRRPGPPEDFISGSTNNRPFKPGGFEDSQTLGRRLSEDRVNGDWVNELVCSGSLQTVPPGFKHGMDFGFSKAFIDKNRISNTDSELNIESSAAVKSDQLSVQYDDLFKKAWEENILEKETDDESSDEEEPSVSNNQDEEVDSLSKNQSGIYAENQFGNQDVQITNKTTSFNSETQDATKPEANILDEILKASEVNTSQREAKPDAESKEIWAVIVEGEEISKNFTELVPDLALAFPFELDKFQKEAIYHIERGDSVFVAAHTSAGKTVVAEYAFALAAKHCTRAVYTSPIKTISNQKYRDFSEKFDVGLLTGDVSLRPEASCLIMTTEILRSMLYKGADIIRDIEWVIFDEVHYVNDIERGVVWEEVIIMLPKHINFVLLSATVPNKLEFADWIGRTKRKKIYVTGTTQRPVPLEHHLYYSGDLYKICEREKFLPSGVKFAKDAYNKKNKIKQAPTRTAAPNSQGNDKWGGHQQQRMPGNLGHGTSRNPNSVPWKTETSQLNMMMKMLSKKGWLPIVVFCFSKNRCDQAADSLTALDLTSGSEKSEIHVFCEKAFSRLKGSDRHLPQVVRVQNLLRRGIGVHHAGLLPIVKEVVEMLFCRGVIKVLFSTETFAMGVNAPAKTVAFHSVRKFDGKSFRQLLPGEYTQMAGRAGRRGLDEVGIVVIICWDEIPDESDLKNIIIGKPTKLESQFRLTYTMILNLLRVEDLKIEDMLKRSFAEFHAQRALPEQQKQLLKGEGELSKMNSLIDCIRGEPKIDEYHDTAIEVDKLNAEIHEAVMQSRAVKLAITAGRVIIVRTHLVRVHSLGVVLKPPSATNKNPIVLVLIQDPSFSIPEMEISNKISQTGDNKFSEGYYRKGNKNIEDDYSLFGNLPRKPSGVVNLSLPHYGKTPDSAYVVTEVENKDFVSLCKNKIQVDIYRLLEDVNTSAYTMTVQQLLQILRQQPNQYPAGLDPVKDLKLSDVDTVQGYQKLQKLLQKMSQNYCHGCPKLFENYKLVQDRQTLMEKVKKLRYEMSDAALQKMPDFQQRIEVLQEVGCIDLDLVVQLKGRVACEINSGDELIATEMLFENQLDDLEPAEAVAIMSSLIFQQKETSNTHLTPQLDMAKKRLFQTAMRLGELQARYGLPLNPKDYADDSLKFGLVEVVYEWAKGTPFADICQLTDVPEGAIVRTIVRLDETCREFKNAARIMGNSALYEKMDIGSNAIKRDIVFAASLYVTGVPS